MEHMNRKWSHIKKKINLISSTNQNSKISEQYRMIRTNFLSFTNVHKYQTLLFTSPKRSEGKSTTVANFAITLAQQGKKVLLIDADLRNSSLHLSFKKDNSIGLSNILNGKTMLEDTISKTDVRGLDFLPSGPVPFNPAELLGSKEMVKLIQTATELYDVVLFDSPPVLEVADAKIIANQCDGLLLVFRWGKTQSDKAIDAKRFLETASAKLLGIIINEKE